MYEHGVPVLRPPVRLSAQSLPLFERVTRAYADGSQGGVVLDLREVRAITSAGLGHLVTLGRSLWEHEAVLVLAGANRTVLKLLKTVGLDRVLPHFTTVGEAAAWLRERRKTPS